MCLEKLFFYYKTDKAKTSKYTTWKSDHARGAISNAQRDTFEFFSNFESLPVVDQIKMYKKVRKMLLNYIV